MPAVHSRLLLRPHPSVCGGKCHRVRSYVCWLQRVAQHAYCSVQFTTVKAAACPCCCAFTGVTAGVLAQLLVGKPLLLT